MKIGSRRFTSCLVLVCGFGLSFAFTGDAFGQNLPACVPPVGYCNNAAGGNVYRSVVLSAAVGIPECAPGTQHPIADCDATRLRRDGANSGQFVTAGTAQITPGQQFTVQALPGLTTSRSVVQQRDPRYGGLRLDVQGLQTDVRTLDHNDGVLTLALNDEIARRGAGEVVLANNDRVLAQRIAETDVRAREGQRVGWQVQDLRSETRYRVFTPFRASWQAGGSPVVSTAGLGLGLTKWGEGSDWGLDFAIAVNGFASQPLVPGDLPLLNLATSLGAVGGRGNVQGLLDLQLSLTGRFGDAALGQATGPTQADATIGGGVRFEVPLWPSSRPNGSRFYGQLRGGLGAGFVQAIVAGQPPLHVGFTLAGTVVFGIAL